MPRWTLNTSEDVFVIERTADGTLTIDIVTRRPARVTRAEIEDLRRKLGAAIADEGEPQCP